MPNIRELHFRAWAKTLGLPWSARVVRLGLALVFVWSGTAKLASIKAFAQTISEYGLVPEPLLLPMAVGLPLVELVAGIGLILNLCGCLEVVTALLLLFIGVLWFGILKDLDIDCGCFSPLEQAEHGSLRQAFYRDFFFLAGAGFLFWARHRQARNKVIEADD